MKKTTLLGTLLIITLSLFSQLPNNIPSDGLVAYWPFNGNANDVSGNNHNGICSGVELTTDRFGNKNAAYSFVGGDVIEIPHSPQLNISSHFTIAMWYLPKTSISAQDLFMKGTDGRDGSYWIRHHDFNFNSPNLDFAYRTDDKNYDNLVPTPSLNKWHLIVGVVSGTTMSIYHNGELISITNNIPNLTRVNNQDNVTIGTRQYNFVGKIDDIGVWNRALSVLEINQIFIKTKTDETPGALSPDKTETIENYEEKSSNYTSDSITTRKTSDTLGINFSLKDINIGGDKKTPEDVVVIQPIDKALTAWYVKYLWIIITLGLITMIGIGFFLFREKLFKTKSIADNNSQSKQFNILDNWKNLTPIKKGLLAFLLLYLVGVIIQNSNSTTQTKTANESKCSTSFSEARQIAEDRVSGKGMIQDGFTSQAYGTPIHMFLCVMYGNQYCNLAVSECGDITAVNCGGEEIINLYEKAKSGN